MNSTETSRIEELLKAILGVEAKLEPPQSRIEVLLWAILESGGGGGGGTTNYNLLTNLPQIGGVELKGNKTAAQLGLQSALTFDNVPTAGSNNPVKSGGVYNALANKQDTLTFDTEPTENSTNPVTSGGVYEAISDIGVEIDFDEEDFDVDDTINMVSLLPKRRIFSGTTTEWEALTTAQKTFYGYAAFTDDEGETPIVAPEVGDITTSVTDVTGKYAKTGHVVQVMVYKHTSATLEDQTFTVRLPYKSAIPFYGLVYYITDIVGYCSISANSKNLNIHLDSGVTEFEFGLTYITTE